MSEPSGKSEFDFEEFKHSLTVPAKDNVDENGNFKPENIDSEIKNKIGTILLRSGMGVLNEDQVKESVLTIVGRFPRNKQDIIKVVEGYTKLKPTLDILNAKEDN